MLNLFHKSLLLRKSDPLPLRLMDYFEMPTPYKFLMLPKCLYPRLVLHRAHGLI